MRIFYIAPSIMPSRSANSIHVVRMCEAFVLLGHDVTLVFQRSIPDNLQLKAVLERYYGVDLGNTRMVSFFRPWNRATNIQIAFIALYELFKGSLKQHSFDLLVSRNLYASFAVGVLLRRSLIFETHQLEYGYRRFMQIALIKCPWVTTVVISQKLQQRLIEECVEASSHFMVLRDAAPIRIKKMLPNEKMAARTVLKKDIDLDSYSALAGYFGHLYPGRGINIIQSLAIQHPDIAFLLFGGNEAEIKALRFNNEAPNLHFMGHIAPSQVASTMCIMDVLLMPYQKNVSIGQRNEDTGQWMSPMKMFEYMASGVPFIASKLPVLEEVLRDDHNCLMAVPDDPNDWSSCLLRLRNNPELAERLTSTAHTEHLQNYNWISRAKKML